MHIAMYYPNFMLPGVMPQIALETNPGIACSDKWVKSNLKFGAPNDCLVGKYKAFGEQISTPA